MSNLDNLKNNFHDRMIEIYDQAKAECNYSATRFYQMVSELGGLKAAQKLLATNKPSEGLTRLWEEKRLDISMEATILQKPWCNLFSETELLIAKKKLKELGYTPESSCD